MQGQELSGEPRPSWDVSVAMLRAVLDGAAYDAMAALHGVSRTAVERRSRAVGAAFVRRLRLHRDALQTALDGLQPPGADRAMGTPILSEPEIAAGAVRIRGRSQHLLGDLALCYMLFAIGARPLEIARLEVRDYLDAAGSVRRVPVLREEAAITSWARPLYFHSTRLNEAMNAYLADRVRCGTRCGRPVPWLGAWLLAAACSCPPAARASRSRRTERPDSAASGIAGSKRPIASCSAMPILSRSQR